MAGGNVAPQLAPIFNAAGHAYNIPPAVLAGIASVETNLGANNAVSSTGARGLMQFEPGTAAGLGVNVNDPRSEIFGAAKLLVQYGYHQDPSRAIGAYNGGPGNPQMGYAAQVLSEAKRLAPQLGGVGGASAFPGGATNISGQPGFASVPVSTQTFDQAGYNAARARFIAGQAVQEAGSSANPFNDGSSSGSNPLLSVQGLLSTTQPNPQDYVSTQTKNIQVATGHLQRLAGMPLVNVHAGAAGDVNPIPGAVIGRTDMGVDANLKPGSPILAPNDGKVVAVVPDWYKGQNYVAVQLLAGPNKGKVMYVAEQITQPPAVGSVVRRGQPIVRYANSGTGIEIGWANPSNPTQTLAQATTGYSEGQQTRAGTNFRSYLGAVGAR